MFSKRKGHCLFRPHTFLAAPTVCVSLDQCTFYVRKEGALQALGLDSLKPLQRKNYMTLSDVALSFVSLVNLVVSKTCKSCSVWFVNLIPPIHQYYLICSPSWEMEESSLIRMFKNKGF